MVCRRSRPCVCVCVCVRVRVRLGGCACACVRVGPTCMHACVCVLVGTRESQYCEIVSSHRQNMNRLYTSGTPILNVNASNGDC